MKKFTNILTYFIRVLAIILIGLNFIRIFEDYEFLFFLQNPPALALLNSLVLLLFSYLRPIFKKFNLEISDFLYTLLGISMLLTQVLGLIFHFYQTVPGYDSFAHFLNGGLLVLVGLMFLSLLVKKETLKELSPFFIVLFAFLFASTLGIIWEMIEYSVDGLFGSNMQRFAEMNVVDGVPEIGADYVGRVVLLDTMKDIFLNTVGSLIVCLVIYFDLKRELPYINNMYVRRINQQEKEN